NGRLNLRNVADMEIHPVQAPGAGSMISELVFSPDGQSIAFFSFTDLKLKKVAVSGGAPVVICATDAPFGASWGADNRILIGQGPRGILRVSADGGEPE